MNKIEKILEKNMEEYESARRQALKFIHENQKDLEKNYEYAKNLELPVEGNQAFFFIDDKKPGSELLKAMLKYNSMAQAIELQVACIRDGHRIWGNSDIPYVKENSPEYWKALATSGYIFSNVPFPVCFVKRSEQVYFNMLSDVYETDDLNTVDFISGVTREFLKTDYIFAPSRQAAEKTWLEKSCAGRVYNGKILVSALKEPDLAGPLLECIADQEEKREIECISFRNFDKKKKEEPKKKKILFISSWKGNRQTKALVRRFLENMDPEIYDIAVYSGCLNNKEDRKDFLTLPEYVTKIMGNGRMVAGEEAFRIYRIIEKNPVVYLENEEVRSYIDVLLEREWGRLFGSSTWDVVVWAGCEGYLPYYLAAGTGTKASMKVLADLDFLPYIHEKHPAAWNRAVTVFHRIYAPADCLYLGNYGQENRLRVLRLPVLPAEKTEETEIVSYNGLTYMVCDKWKVQGDRTAMKLVEMPEAGGILVNGDVPPSKEQKEKLKALEQEHKLYVLGAQSSAYLSFLKKAVALDEYVRKELYLLPAAWEFFGAFEGYVKNPAVEEDVTGKMCKAFHVQEIKMQQ